jgi:hypothetical protein
MTFEAESLGEYSGGRRNRPDFGRLLQEHANNLRWAAFTA